VHRGRLTSPEDCERVVAEVVDAHGRLDIVVCLAGRRGFGFVTRLDQLDTGAWDMAMAAQLSGPYYLMRAAVPRMVEQGYGRIVTVLPVEGGAGTEGQGTTGVATAGLEALTRRLAREVAGSGVTVNAVACGMMESAFMPDAIQAEARALVPAGRLGRAADVARAVAFLCDPESEFVTGQVIAADGGLRA
jgi:NAD(P)-dependent dehydrogenase (short-subunit alcohol dehydrogenase family)